ncbi:aminoacyl-histidine dipeptidase [Paenibacillus sp. J5C_2022]|uniref:aminoacyl-histidine dipeptidase n=1 Tax=Paenibacillus sp. J5C2022 TaxID=2977129 RepID=UPI0021D11968|nr:aminoacyl-histidine dipeptidase [Paenibacillus sp. J5C2022]MCU6707295.1 aminoacyl-histidine dipeptidase [Paenibacillus sp. J5C2022]
MKSNNETKVYNGECLVLRHFEELSKIPRASGNEKGISDYVAEFAMQRGCTAEQDERFNLIIRKPAAKGYEEVEPVIFQGHLDMVCEMNKGTTHDFANDPISLRIDGDMIYARGTTLGADNGIAVATALAIIDMPDMAHPELEMILTTEEETTMGGAFHLDASTLKGRRMINFDSDREGILFVSSAGGVNIYHSVPIQWTKQEGEAGQPYKLSVHGLKGGHSGDDIIHERGNANKLLGRMLDDLRRHTVFQLAGVHGGMKVNAIPREAEASLYLHESEIEAAEARVQEMNRILSEEYLQTDEGVEITLQADASSHPDGRAGSSSGKVFDDATKTSVIRLLALMPSGVLSMDKAIDNLVRTSTNPGVMTTDSEAFVVQSLARSSHRSQLDDVLRTMETLAQAIGCGCRHDSFFPGWPYRPDSGLRPLFEEVYERRYGKPLEVKAIHAGLECGVLIEKLPELDAVSCGPNLYDIHTPDEHLSISSVERTWAFLQDVLQAMKE